MNIITIRPIACLRIRDAAFAQRISHHDWKIWRNCQNHQWTARGSPSWWVTRVSSDC